VGKVECLAQPPLTLFWYNLSLKDHAEDLLVSLILVQDAKWIDWGAHLLPCPITKKVQIWTSARRRDARPHVGQLVLFTAERECIPRVMSVSSGREEQKGI